MINGHIHIAIFFSFLLSLAAVSPIQNDPIDTVNQPTIPTVFLIGEYEEQYDEMKQAYPNSLLDICDRDMKEAFSKWMDMITAMETYSEAIGYDIRGLKVWFNVYWTADGQVDHLAYFLKPDSKNYRIDEIQAFFQSFLRQYKLQLESSTPFWHSGSATFPSFYREIKDSLKKETPAKKRLQLKKDSI